MQKANEVQRISGISYEESEVAPQTFPEVLHEFTTALIRKRPVRVASGGCDKTVYIHPYVDWAFRFWNSYLHYKHALDFSVGSKQAIGRMHIEAVEHEFGKGSLEANIMFCDTIGQVLYYEHIGEYVYDREEFALSALAALNDEVNILPPIGKHVRVALRNHAQALQLAA